MKYKSWDQFHDDRTSKIGFKPECKNCQAKRCKEGMKYYIIQKRYGLTPFEYEQLFEKANHKCQICGSMEKLCIDHCHKTHNIRGILCDNCNKAIGLLHHDPEFLLKAHIYI